MNEWDERSFDWPVYGEARVMEVGGFEGRWVSEMGRRYSGDFHVFEPQLWAHPRLRAEWRSKALPFNRLHLHPFGLGVRAERLPMRGWGTDANSFLKTDAFYQRHPGEGRRDEGEGELLPVGKVLDSLQLDEIDVTCMNIEGYEFVLLPEMYRLGLLSRLRFVAVQFHDGYDVEYDEGDVRAMFAHTHDLLWDYPGTLTAWVRRDG